MAVERAIEKLEDGTVYAEQIGMFFYEESDEEGNPRLVFTMHPDSLYFPAYAAMSKVMSGGVTPTDDPEQKKRNNFAKLMKVAIKGMLLMYGESILEYLFLTKEHPKPQKGDDLLAWYTDIFTKMAISHLMKHDIILHGQYNVDENHIKVSRLATRPVTVSEPSGDDV